MSRTLGVTNVEDELIRVLRRTLKQAEQGDELLDLERLPPWDTAQWCYTDLP